MEPIGHLVKYKDGLRGSSGKRGVYFDYVLASNGLFIEVEGPLLAARIPVALAEVRGGLATLEPKIVLRHGRIPQRFFDLAMSSFLADKYHERYVAVVWEGEYRIVVPDQAENPDQLAAGDQGGGCEHGVTYANPANAILDLHSHGRMKSFFSQQDDEDETGLKLYGVVGKLDDEPVVQLRVGVYGYFLRVQWEEIFEGCLIGVKDYLEQDIEEELCCELSYFPRK